MGYYKAQVSYKTRPLYKLSERDTAMTTEAHENTHISNFFIVDFNDIKENFTNSSAHYYSDVIIGNYILREGVDTIYYTDAQPILELPEIFDDDNKISVLVRNHALSDEYIIDQLNNNFAQNYYDNSALVDDTAVLSPQDGTSYAFPYITQSPYAWFPFYPENVLTPYLRNFNESTYNRNTNFFNEKIKSWIYGEMASGVHAIHEIDLDGEACYGVIHPVTNDVINENFQFSSGVTTQLYRYGDDSAYAVKELGVMSFTENGRNVNYCQLLPPKAVRFRDSLNTYRMPSIQRQETPNEDLGWENGLSNLWCMGYCGIALDSISEVAYWIIPDMGQYDTPSNSYPISRYVAQPIVAYTDYSGKWEYDVHSAYELILNVFWGGELPEKETSLSYDDEEVETPENLGGNGSFEHSLQKDDVISSSAMSYTVTNGFTRIYVMSTTPYESEGNKLVDYVESMNVLRMHGWSDLLNRDMKKSFADIMEKGSLRLYSLPVALSGTNISEPGYWFVGGVPVGLNVSDNLQWQRWWGGDSNGFSKARHVTTNEISFSVDITSAFKKFYDSFADYSPYTEAVVFLPYIGWQSIPLGNLYQFSSVRVHYKIGVLTGDVVCYIEGDGVALTSWTGRCSVDIPLIQNDVSSILTNAVSNTIKTVSRIGGAVVGGIIGGGSGATMGSNVAGSVADFIAPNATERGRIDVNSTPPSGLDGYMLPQKIYITFHRTHIVTPEKFSDECGEVFESTVNLSKIHGYTEVREIQLRCSATDDEKSEILSLLRAGVILP